MVCWVSGQLVPLKLSLQVKSTAFLPAGQKYRLLAPPPRVLLGRGPSITSIGEGQQISAKTPPTRGGQQEFEHHPT